MRHLLGSTGLGQAHLPSSLQCSADRVDSFSQAQACSVPNLPPPLVVVPWSWQFQYRGVSIATEAAPSPMVLQALPHGSKPHALLNRFMPQNWHHMHDSHTLFAKFNCQPDVQPQLLLDHSFCVLLPSKYLPDFTSMMLRSCEPQLILSPRKAQALIPQILTTCAALRESSL